MSNLGATYESEYTNETYTASTDYMDYLECGMSPPDNSQYWVSTNVKECFLNYVVKYRPEIAELIYNKTFMELK